jgi:hypothetical protein
MIGTLNGNTSPAPSGRAFRATERKCGIRRILRAHAAVE